MAQAFRGNRRNQAINDSLSSAFDLGIQPGQKRNNAIVMTTPNRKKTLRSLLKTAKQQMQASTGMKIYIMLLLRLCTDTNSH